MTGPGKVCVEGYILDSSGLCKVFYDFRTGFVVQINGKNVREVLKFSLYAGLAYRVPIVNNLESFIFDLKRM